MCCRNRLQGKKHPVASLNLKNDSFTQEKQALPVCMQQLNKPTKPFGALMLVSAYHTINPPNLQYLFVLLKQTDPENCDYTLEDGATRNFEAHRTAEEMAKKELKEIEEEERNNPMKVCTAMYNVMSEVRSIESKKILTV